MTDYAKYFEKHGISYNILKFPTGPNDFQDYPYRSSDIINVQPLASTSNNAIRQAKHAPSGTQIAIKIAHLPIKKDPNFEKNFEQRIQELKLHHTLKRSPNVIDYYGFYVKSTDLFICLELMDISLDNIYKQVRESYGHFPEHMLGAITVAVVNGLEHCKKHQIIHRDLKPGNILVKYSGEIKIADFGVSRVLVESLASTTVGTFPYWPPERFRSAENYSVKTDVWSLGITLLELICGSLPYNIYYGNRFRAGDFVAVQRQLENLHVSEMINQCLTRTNTRNLYSDNALNFLRECLNPVDSRPVYGPIKERKFYLENSNRDISKEFNNIKNHYCALCNISCSGPTPWREHLKKSTHLANAVKIQDNEFRTTVCTRFFEQPRQEPRQQLHQESDRPQDPDFAQNQNRENRKECVLQ